MNPAASRFLEPAWICMDLAVLETCMDPADPGHPRRILLPSAGRQDLTLA